jgi:hypothetical protein
LLNKQGTQFPTSQINNHTKNLIKTTQVIKKPQK